MFSIFKKVKSRLSKMASSTEGDVKPVTAIVVGAGARGRAYSSYELYEPARFKIVGVCDPNEYHRNNTAQKYEIAERHVFKDWSEAAALDKFADCVLVCTQDRLHKEPTVAFAKKGYHILLEKPMAVTEEECLEIVETCQTNNVILCVCHVLRYTPWVQKIKEIIDSSDLGDIVSINHTEPVGFYHFAHSYVRGNWHNESQSTFSLLAKCCHDVDLLCYWMSGTKCRSVSSFGNLSHFNKKCKPKDAASRCLDCPESVESKCPYSAKKIYLDRVKRGDEGWPHSALCDIVDVENITEALKTGPYGKCVYDTDNDVMSHQVVSMQFETGATATLHMEAFTERLCCRKTTIYGTRGELNYEDGDFTIKVFDFLTQRSSQRELQRGTIPGKLGGHGGADYHTIRAFVDAVANPDKSSIQTGPLDTLASHMLVFAAERARKENRVLNLQPDGNYT